MLLCFYKVYKNIIKMKKIIGFVFVFSVFMFLGFNISNAQVVTSVNTQSSSLLMNPAPIRASSTLFPPYPIPITPTTTAYNNANNSSFIGYFITLVTDPAEQKAGYTAYGIYGNNIHGVSSMQLSGYSSDSSVYTVPQSDIVISSDARALKFFVPNSYANPFSTSLFSAIKILFNDGETPIFLYPNFFPSNGSSTYKTYAITNTSDIGSLSGYYVYNDNVTGDSYFVKIFTDSAGNKSIFPILSGYRVRIVFDYYEKNPNIVFYDEDYFGHSQNPDGSLISTTALMKSTDGGNTWTNMTSGILSYLNGDYISMFGGIEINQLSSTPNDIVIRIVTSKHQNGIWLESFDGGNTWGPISSISPNSATSTISIATSTTPTIVSFTASNPDTRGGITFSWEASGVANAQLDFSCVSSSSIKFITNEGNYPICDKGGVWVWNGQSSGNIVVTPFDDPESVTMPFTLTLFNNNQLSQQQTLYVTFPATNNTMTSVTSATSTTPTNSTNNSTIQQQLIQLMTLLIQLLQKAILQGGISSNLLNSAIGSLQNISQ